MVFRSDVFVLKQNKFLKCEPDRVGCLKRVELFLLHDKDVHRNSPASQLTSFVDILLEKKEQQALTLRPLRHEHLVPALDDGSWNKGQSTSDSTFGHPCKMSAYFPSRPPFLVSFSGTSLSNS